MLILCILSFMPYTPTSHSTLLHYLEITILRNDIFFIPAFLVITPWGDLNSMVHSYHLTVFRYCLIAFFFFYIPPQSFLCFIYFRYLMGSQRRQRSINDIMPMIGARFYTQLDAAQLRSDVVENELAKVSFLIF